MPRILIDIRPLLDARRAGVGQYTFNLTRTLLDQTTDSDREYVLFGTGWHAAWPTDLPPESDRIRYDHHRLPSKPLNLMTSLAGRPKLECLTRDFDAAWLPNLTFAASNKPYAVTVHDLSFRHFPEFFSQKQRLWHQAVRPERLLQQAARVIAVSEHTKLDIQESYGVPAEKITVISPAAGPQYWPANPDQVTAIRQRHRLPEKFFLHLGTIEPRKNIDGLISAFEGLKTDAHLVIAGGKGWLWRGVFRQAAASTARDRIHFLDYVPEADKPALYSAAFALAYPSFYEGFGMPPLEAMACGLPVIASHAASLGEVVGAAGLLVDPHDLNELTAAMQALLDDPDLGRALAERGREQATQFRWTDSAAKLDRLLSELPV
jgi:glycosyltransferase involved in cell wall biosynthesis